MGFRDTLKSLFGTAWHVNHTNILDGMTLATDGTVEASKPVILDANKAQDVVRTASLRLGTSGSEVAVTATAAELNTMAGILATVDEINRVADVSTRVVSLTTASPSLTVAAHENKLLVLNKADGIAVTLPAATGSGSVFHFVVGTTFSGGSFVATTTGDDTLKGLALGLDGDGVPANAWAAGASDEIFTMDGSTQGGVVGDEVIFRDIKADVWQVQARLQQSGTEASPFSSAA